MHIFIEFNYCQSLQSLADMENLFKYSRIYQIHHLLNSLLALVDQCDVELVNKILSNYNFEIEGQLSVEGFQQCKKCLKWKPIDEFHVRSVELPTLKRKDRVTQICSHCFDFTRYKCMLVANILSDMIPPNWTGIGAPPALLKKANEVITPEIVELYMLLCRTKAKLKQLTLKF